jgi:hypothetical protein
MEESNSWVYKAKVRRDPYEDDCIKLYIRRIDPENRKRQHLELNWVDTDPSTITPPTMVEGFDGYDNEIGSFLHNVVRAALESNISGLNSTDFSQEVKRLEEHKEDFKNICFKLLENKNGE